MYVCLLGLIVYVIISGRHIEIVFRYFPLGDWDPVMTVRLDLMVVGTYCHVHISFYFTPDIFSFWGCYI